MFGGSVLLDQFPAARLEALPAVVRQMRRYLAPDALQLWRQRFPGEIPPHPAAPRPPAISTRHADTSALSRRLWQSRTAHSGCTTR
jgi:hypothetical protein